MKIQRFEEIIAWQKARDLTRQVYETTRKGAFARDFGLRDQACRAAVSIMANIAEGFDRGGDREFIQFLSVAKASAGELRSHLYVVLDQGYLDQPQFDVLYAASDEVGRLITGFMAYLRDSTLSGRKYK